MGEPEPEPEDDLYELPAWSLSRDSDEWIQIANPLPDRVDREWALAGATGKGVRVCLLDSGVEDGHPRVGDGHPGGRDHGRRGRRADRDGGSRRRPLRARDGVRQRRPCARARGGDPLGARARRRVLRLGAGADRRPALGGRRGLRRDQHEPLDDEAEVRRGAARARGPAYFKRTVVVASAHNMPVESLPWRFSSVISVASHDEADPLVFYANPEPPVEFFAHGVDVEVGWIGGGTIHATGNSFATPVHRRDRRTDPEQASGPDAVPAQDGALPHLDERGRLRLDDRRRERDARGSGCRRPGGRERLRRPAAVGGGGGARDLRRTRVLDPPLRRGDRRARLRRGRGRRRAGSRRAAHALRHGHRGLGAVVAHPARARGRRERSSLRPRGGGEDRATCRAG